MHTTHVAPSPPKAVSFVPGLSGCFECTTVGQPSGPKQYPVCTIRNTPDLPIHCIVWAKELLLPRLFGPQDGVTDLDEDPRAF